MPVSPEELQRLLEADQQNLSISGFLYCAACGYCLRRLPLHGRCPECGGYYNAGSRLRPGIFVGEDRRLPILALLATVLCLAICVSSTFAWQGSGSRWSAGAAIFTACLGLAYLHLTVKRFLSYLDCREKLRRIREVQPGE